MHVARSGAGLSGCPIRAASRRPMRRPIKASGSCQVLGLTTPGTDGGAGTGGVGNRRGARRRRRGSWRGRRGRRGWCGTRWTFGGRRGGCFGLRRRRRPRPGPGSSASHRWAWSSQKPPENSLNSLSSSNRRHSSSHHNHNHHGARQRGHSPASSFLPSRQSNGRARSAGSRGADHCSNCRSSRHSSRCSNCHSSRHSNRHSSRRSSRHSSRRSSRRSSRCNRRSSSHCSRWSSSRCNMTARQPSHSHRRSRCHCSRHRAVVRRDVGHVARLVMTAQSAEGHQHHDRTLHCHSSTMRSQLKLLTRDRHLNPALVHHTNGRASGSAACPSELTHTLLPTKSP